MVRLRLLIPRPPDPAGWWRTLTRRNGDFEWVYGLRVALAFGGPYVVAHLIGRLGTQSEVVAYAGLLVALSTHGLPRPRQLRYSLALATVLPAVGLLDLVIAPPSLPHIAVLAGAAVVGGLSLGASSPLPAFGLLFGLGVIMVPATAANLTTVWLLLVGGLVAGLVLIVTEPLLHTPRRGADALGRILSAFAHLLEERAAGAPVDQLHLLERELQRSIFEAFELVGSDRHQRRLVVAARDALDAFLLLDLTTRSAPSPPPPSLLSALAATGRTCRIAGQQLRSGGDPTFAGLTAIAESLPARHWPDAVGGVVPDDTRDRDRMEQGLRILIGHLQTWDAVAHDHVFNQSSRLDRLRAGIPPLVRWHTVRLVLALTVAGTAAWAIGAHTGLGVHTNWMLLGLWLVLQAGANPTTQKATQRAVGTIAGAGLTLALIPVLQFSAWSGYVILLITFVCFGIQYVNYAVYAVLLTPIAVVGFDGPAFDAGTIEARVIFTVAGCALAIVARLVCWPGRYQEPLTDTLVVRAARQEGALASTLRTALSGSDRTVGPDFGQAARAAWPVLSDLRLCHSGKIKDVPQPASADTAPVALHALLEVHHFSLATASRRPELSESERSRLCQLTDEAVARLSAVGAAPLRPADQDTQLDQSAGNLALVDLAWLTPELQRARATLQDSYPGDGVRGSGHIDRSR
jgi:hypothetical protein